MSGHDKMFVKRPKDKGKSAPRQSGHPYSPRPSGSNNPQPGRGQSSSDRPNGPGAGRSDTTAARTLAGRVVEIPPAVERPEKQQLQQRIESARLEVFGVASRIQILTMRRTQLARLNESVTEHLRPSPSERSDGDDHGDDDDSIDDLDEDEEKKRKKSLTFSQVQKSFAINELESQIGRLRRERTLKERDIKEWEASLEKMRDDDAMKRMVQVMEEKLTKSEMGQSVAWHAQMDLLRKEMTETKEDVAQFKASVKDYIRPQGSTAPFAGVDFSAGGGSTAGFASRDAEMNGRTNGQLGFMTKDPRRSFQRSP